MTAVLLVMLTAALAGIACYNFICVGRDIPTGQTSKMMILSGRREGTRKETWGTCISQKQPTCSPGSSIPIP